ncbi:MAG: lipid-A-disaccharide synthase [Planctomycetota bacterium]|jgi:lipid-A-disaccharide synthase
MDLYVGRTAPAAYHTGMAPSPSPRSAARLELLRSALDLGLSLPRLARYYPFRKGYEARVAQDLAGAPAPVESCPVGPLPERPLRIFLAVAEPSGEGHGARLAQAITALARELGAPAPELRGLGGEELAAAGVQTLADPGAQASMGSAGPLRALPFYLDLIEDSARCFRDWLPDLFVPVDSPALFIPMARTAQRYGVPCVHHIAPQFWGWAPWRVKRYRKHIQQALTIMPFEPAWYARHGVATGHVGHPLLDALQNLPTPPSADAPERNALILLPGSRGHEIDDNLGWMLQVVQRFIAAKPGTPVRVLQSSPRQERRIQTLLEGHPQVELRVGDLHTELAHGRVALAVSGTVLTDLLHHRMPACAIYRDTGAWKSRMIDVLLTCRSFVSTNLVAGKPVLPEHCFRGDGPQEEVASWLISAWDDPELRQELAAGMQLAAERLGPPGAAKRAASFVLHAAAERARAQGSGRAHS